MRSFERLFGRSNRRSDTIRPFFSEVSALTQILQYLKKHGPRLDAEIAKATGMPLETVRQRVAKLRATGNVITCDLTRFEEGKPIQARICRVSGYTPPPAPGRKPKRAAVVSEA